MKNAKSTRPQATDSYKVGDQLQIECVDGYLVKGDSYFRLRDPHSSGSKGNSATAQLVSRCFLSYYESCP